MDYARQDIPFVGEARSGGGSAFSDVSVKNIEEAGDLRCRNLVTNLLPAFDMRREAIAWPRWVFIVLIVANVCT
jgi:hypothetical protein